MSKFPNSDNLAGHIVQISRCDRWQVYHRLQELKINFTEKLSKLAKDEIYANKVI